MLILQVYDTWHKTDLEKWLDDHDIPYPSPADRKDLADLVEKNWDKVSAVVFETWEDDRLRSWLVARGVEFDVDDKKESIVEQVRGHWYNANDDARQFSPWETVNEWIFDSYACRLVRG